VRSKIAKITQVVFTTDVSRTSWQSEGVSEVESESVGRLVGLLVGRMEILLGTISLSTTTILLVRVRARSRRVVVLQ